MRDLERILVLMEEDEHGSSSMEQAQLLAAHYGASVTVIDVKPHLDVYAKALVDIMPEQELRTHVLDHRRQQLQKIVRKADIPADQLSEVKVLDGVHFIEVIREVLRGEHDMIVKTAEGDVSPTEKLFGSNDMHLMRKSPVPVWISPPNRADEIKNVVAAIDAVALDAEKEEFNRSILGLAGSIASMTGAKLNVLTAWHLVGESSMRASQFLKIDEAQISELLAQTEDKVRRHQLELESWFKRAGIGSRTPEFHQIKGLARDVIPEFIDESGSDLAVMGTIGRSGIPGLLIGNTAETVLGTIRCSVVTLKPEGFITPVTAD